MDVDQDEYDDYDYDYDLSPTGPMESVEPEELPPPLILSQSPPIPQAAPVPPGPPTAIGDGPSYVDKLRDLDEIIANWQFRNERGVEAAQMDAAMMETVRNEYNEDKFRIVSMGIVQREEEELAALARKACRILDRAYSFHVITWSYANDNFDTENMAIAKDAPDVYLPQFEMSAEDESRPSKNNDVADFVMFKASIAKLRHIKERVYEQRFIDGHATHAWVPAKVRLMGGIEIDISSVADFVHYVVSPENGVKEWRQFMDASKSNIIENLEKINTRLFPALFPRYDYMSFKDGIYHIPTDIFVAYGTPQHKALPDDLAVALYHNYNFKGCYEDETGIKIPGWMVETPSFDRIMADQDVDPETKFWVLAVLGRCLYEVGEHDDWQIAPFFRGMAGTGKSTLINLLRAIFTDQYVFSMDNINETVFGLQDLPGKRIWCCAEVGKNFTLDQHRFQMMCSGETIQINIKNKTKVSLDIKSHGFLAGNNMPNTWNDNSGSLRRRLVVVNFKNTVAVMDPGVLTRLVGTEMPATLRRMNCCYRYAAANVTKQLSHHLSRRIKTDISEIADLVNPLRDFINNGEVTKAPGIWCPNNVLGAEFQKWARALGKRSPGWDTDFTNSVFAEFGLQCIRANFTWDGRPNPGSLIVLGICPNTYNDPTVMGEYTPLE